MDETIFDERKADKALIESLMNTTQLLWRELEEKRGMVELLRINKRRNDMKILQDLKGAYYPVKEYTPLAEEEAKKIVAEAKLIAEDVQHNLQMAEQFLQAEAAKVSGQADTTTATEQTTSSPTEQTPPAPTPPADPAQVPPAAPADQSQQVPAPTLTADPNPQVAAPATDPNQVQTQPDPSAAPQLQ
jgi:hypothetical protein